MESPEGQARLTSSLRLGAGRRRAAKALRDPGAAVWYATALLFLGCWLLASGSVSASSLNSMLPFAGVLAVAAVGETLVIQQRGFDLSVPGMMTLAALTVSQYASNHGLLGAILVVVAISIVAGLANGVVVGYLGITPFVATLAMNAVLIGAGLMYSGGTPPAAPSSLANFALNKTVGISNAVWLAAIFVVVVAVVVSRTTLGRRFVAVGASLPAARAAGVRVERYRIAAYVGAALCYGGAGIVLAGYVGSPSVTSGDQFLLPSIAAVAVGGTALTGGRGRVLGSAIAAVFLSQLSQLVVSIGVPTATQLVVQSVVIAIAAALQSLDLSGWMATLQRLTRFGHDVR